MAQGIAVYKGRLKLRSLGALPANGAGLIIYRRLGAGGFGFQILLINRFCCVIVSRQVPIGPAAGTADRPFRAGRFSAGAVLIDRRQGGVVIGHGAGIYGVRSHTGGLAAHGQFPMGEMLPGEGILGGVGDGVSAHMGGGGPLLHIHQGQGIGLYLGDPHILAAAQGVAQGGRQDPLCAVPVLTGPDPEIRGNGGVHGIGGHLAGLELHRAAGDLIGVPLCIGIDVHGAVGGGIAQDLRPGKIQRAAVGRPERIGSGNGHLARRQGGRGPVGNNAPNAARGDDLAAAHGKVRAHIHAELGTGKADSSAGELRGRIGHRQIRFAAREIYVGAAEGYLAAGPNTRGIGGVAGIVHVQGTAGQGGLSRAGQDTQARIRAVQGQFAAGQVQFAALAPGQLNGRRGVECHIRRVFHGQSSRRIIGVAHGGSGQAVAAAGESGRVGTDVFDSDVNIGHRELTTGDLDRSCHADTGRIRGADACQSQFAAL